MKFIKMVVQKHEIKEDEEDHLFTVYFIDKKGKVFKCDTYRDMDNILYIRDKAVISWDVKKCIVNTTWSRPHYSLHINYMDTYKVWSAADKQHINKTGKRTWKVEEVDNLTEVSAEDAEGELLSILI